MYGHYPAKHTVHTAYIYTVYIWFWPTLILKKTIVCTTNSLMSSNCAPDTLSLKRHANYDIETSANLTWQQNTRSQGFVHRSPAAVLSAAAPGVAAAAAAAVHVSVCVCVCVCLSVSVSV